MKLIVPVKMVPNPAIPVRICQDTPLRPDLDNIPMVLNPFDEIALEQAVLLRESATAEQVVVVSIGPESWEAEMRTALALGADRVVRIATDALISPLSIAKCLTAFTVKEAAQLVLCGRQGVDMDRCATGPMTAALLGWGQATFVSKLHIKDMTAFVTREVDGGTEEIAIPLPALITTDLRLNTPRYASLPNIMKARNKPIEQLSPQELGVEVTIDTDITTYQEPPPRPPVTRVNSVTELTDILSAKGFLS